MWSRYVFVTRGTSSTHGGGRSAERERARAHRAGGRRGRDGGAVTPAVGTGRPGARGSRPCPTTRAARGPVVGTPTDDDGGREPGWFPPAVVSGRSAASASPLVSASSYGLVDLHVDRELLELRLVRTGVVPAEEELPTGGKDGTDLRRCTAAVATVRGGEFWPGQGSGHRHLPPFGHRSRNRSRRLRPNGRRSSTVSDRGDDRSCSHAALSWVTYRSSSWDDRCYRVTPGSTRW
jgi:hypothetical protein